MNMLTSVPQTEDEIMEEEMAERPMTLAEQEAARKAARRKARELEEQWKKEQESMQGFIAAPQLTLGPPALIPTRRIIHPSAARLARDPLAQEEIFKEVKNIWDEVWVRGVLQITPSELAIRQKSKNPHICKVTPTCDVVKLEVVVYWPPDSEKDRTGARKHICLPQICQMRSDATLHEPQFIVWRYHNFYSCPSSGNLHHCVGTNGSRCDGHGIVNDEGFWICQISAKEYDPTTRNENEVSKSVLSSSEKESDYSSIYVVEREARHEEYRAIQKLKDMVGQPLGTSVAICDSHGNLLTIPDRPTDYRNQGEYALAELRVKLWNVFFGRKRVVDEMQKTMDLVLQIMHDIFDEYCRKPLPIIDDLYDIVYFHSKHKTGYMDVVGKWDLVDRLRFVNYYAFYCYCIWQHVISNWRRVVLTQRYAASDLDIHPDAVNMSEDVVRLTDHELGNDNRGGMILDNCALAVLRFMVDAMDKSASSHEKFGGHDSLKLIMPPLNALEGYNFVMHAATTTRNLLNDYFSRIQAQSGQTLPSLISMPMVTFEEIRMMPHEVPFDQCRDAEMVRARMEKSLVVPLGCVL